MNADHLGNKGRKNQNQQQESYNTFIQHFAVAVNITDTFQKRTYQKQHDSNINNGKTNGIQ